MSKKWVWFLLLANVLFFAAMRWGGLLTQDPAAIEAQVELRADKIVVLAETLPASVVAPTPNPAPKAVEEVPIVVMEEPKPRLTAELANPPKMDRCLYWGEFSGTGLAEVNTLLNGLKLGKRLQTNIIEHDSGFWVYMPPQKNLKGAQRKVDQLKNLGVEDFYVVLEKGEWLHAISLGVFRTEQAAQNHLDSLRKQGVRTALVGERMSKLRFTQFRIEGVDEAIEAKIRAFQADFPDSELKIADCN